MKVRKYTRIQQRHYRDQRRAMAARVADRLLGKRPLPNHDDKADKDGHIVLGKCIKVSDLYREYADYDFIITLNKEFWEDIAVTISDALK